jgi:putative transposase
MDVFMSDVTRLVNRKTGKTGHLFGGPYFWSIVTNGRYYGHALKYIYRNPVRGGICISVEDYDFSTLRGLGGGEVLPFPLHFTRTGMESFIPDPELFDAWLEWLNQPFPAEAENLIRKCFRKKEMKELLIRSSRTRNHLLSHLL